MKRSTIFLAILAMFAPMTAAAETIPPTSLNYEAHFRLGFFNKDAGKVSVNYECCNNDLQGSLIGESIPFFGTIYAVSDTLHVSIVPGDNEENITYINGWYTKPSTGSAPNHTDPSDYITIDGQGSLDASSTTMEAIDVTANMISLFYFAKSLDFEGMSQGQTVKIPIRRANGANEFLTITYNGSSLCEYVDCGDVYDITFNFSHDGEPSAYPVTCQVAKDTRYPVLFSADLTIGHVNMTLTD